MTSMNSYPKGMILQFARQNPEKVREMFRSLFDESRDVIERIFKFKKESESLRLEYSPNAKNHFQDENTIVKYLWLKYPNKYYIYKIRELQAIASKLAVNLEFKQGRFTDNWPKFMALYDAIRDVLTKNMVARYSEQRKLYSHNLYQIFTYVKNMQEAAVDCNVSGLLLYARTTDRIQPDAECVMSGNKILAKTLDLFLPFNKIVEQLNKVAECVKHG